MAMVMVAAVLDGTDDEDDDDNDDVQHDVKDDPIVDSRRRLKHNIMSSITGGRHNCEHGQPKPQLGGGAQPTTTTKPQGGAGKGTTTGPTPQGGRGGHTMGWGGGGGRGGVAALHHIYMYVQGASLWEPPNQHCSRE